jgi:small subunit ribosomal protein S16
VAVKIRLKRFGKRHRQFFRINAIDIRTPRDGRVIEELGWYDPIAQDPEKQICLKRDRVEYWLAKGAQPSDTVAQLLKRQGM